jgi:hypothetical protein
METKLSLSQLAQSYQIHSVEMGQGKLLLDLLQKLSS